MIKIDKNLISTGNETGEIKSSRNSNLELLRIICMLLIISHHLVVNSGVAQQYDFSNISLNMIFMQLFGMWGKTGINAFILISGYFLCEMTLNWQRWLKVYLQWKSYRFVIFLILLIVGYESVSLKGLISLLIEIARNINDGFIASFLLFYFYIPFYNLLIRRMNKRNFGLLVVNLLIVFTGFGTFLKADRIFTESLWYMVLYFLAAYIRRYPPKWMSNYKVTVIGLIVSVILSWSSVIIIDFVSVIYGKELPYYYFVSDSHKILALAVSLFAFLTFRNMKERNNKWINTVASTVFGVLCIHASSDAMRTMLWKDIVDVPNAYYMPIGKLILYVVLVVMTIFVTCSVVDYMRICFIEKPLFKAINKKTMNWQIENKNFVKKFLASYNSIERY